MTARDRRSGRPAPAQATPVPQPPPAPPLARDPWAFVTLLGVLPLLARCWGAPLGEPVAEDFDFLHRALFHGLGSLLDGGGSQAFWRPLAHQVYYAALGGLVLGAPLAVGLLSAALLALGGLLLYRIFRLGMSGPVAAIAASVPLMAESTRTLVGWPTQSVDLGMFLFAALALHEFSRRRLPTALAALIAALLCKEVSIVACVLLPLLPATVPRRDRVRAAIGSAAVTAAWAALYLYVRRTAHLELPHGVEHAAAPPLVRLAWALRASALADLSLDLVTTPRHLPALLAAAALGIALAGVLATSRAARARAARSRAWIAWGLAWFLLASAALTPIYPLWQPNRSQVGSVGLGAALVPVLAAAHPALAGGLVVLRLALLGLAPGAAEQTRNVAPETGAFMDFSRLTRLQHFMRGMRAFLHARHPHLPPHARVVLTDMPHGLVYAFGGDHALQVWYRDSTLRLVSVSEYQRTLERPADCVIQYRDDQQPELVEVPAAAFLAQCLATAAMNRDDPEGALRQLARAESLWTGPDAAAFHSGNLGLAAFALENAGRHEEALATARRTLELHAHDRNALMVMVEESALRGAFAQADALLDTLVAIDPGNATYDELRADVATMRAGAARRPPAR